MNQSSLIGMSVSEKENFIKLYCHKCQNKHNMDKFNHFSTTEFICCCFQLKDIKHKQHYSLRSKCCEVCATAEIRNEGFVKLPSYKFPLKCKLCADQIKVYFMNKLFPTLSDAHDYFFIVENE